MNELDPDKWSEERVEQLLSERNRAMELSYVFGGRDPHPNFTKIKERLLASKTAQAVSQAAANTAASQVTSEVAIRQEVYHSNAYQIITMLMSSQTGLSLPWARLQS